MAVIQAIFKHASPTDPETTQNKFYLNMRRLVVPEVNEWRTSSEIVLDWGDPAYSIDAETLALACRNDEARPLFGRSWLYYHHATHRLVLSVDRLGMFPILLKQMDDTTCIATDALALSQLPGCRTEANPQALLELLAYGQLLGEQTSLCGAEYLEAGTVCTLQANGTYHNRLSAPFYLPRESGTEQNALDALVAVVAKRFYDDPDTLLPLSGGLDSRLLLAAAHAAGYHPATFSFAPPGSLDFQIAQSLANAIGSKFYTVDVTPRHLAQAQDNIARLGSGEVPMTRGCALLCPDLVARTRGNTLMTSLGAKTYRGVYYDRGIPGSELLGAAGLKKTLLKTARRYAEDAFDRYLTPFANALPSLRDTFRERLQVRLDIYQSQADDAARYLDAVFLGEHVRRNETAIQQLLSRDYARTHPFLDPEVIQAMSALPLSSRLGSRFQRRAIGKLSPQLAEVDWDKTMRPLHESLRWEERYMGLAGYLGITPPANYTQTACDTELQSWLNSTSEQTGYLWHALQQLEIPESAISVGIHSLLSSPIRLHVLGALASYSAWSDYLHQRQESLAA